MRTQLSAVVFVGLLGSSLGLAQEAEPLGKKPTEAPSESQVVPLQAREVIERLRTMRAQLLLDEEYNRLLEARVKRQELEDKLLGAPAKDGSKPKKEKADPSRGITMAPPPSLEAAAERHLTVKSVTVSPFKEAFVVYKGRTYTVRPGDQLGDLTIRDINENGVVTNRASVPLEH